MSRRQRAARKGFDRKRTQEQQARYLRKQDNKASHRGQLKERTK